MTTFDQKPDNSLSLNNVGSYRTPSFASPQTNPFGLIDVGPRSKPTFADIDGDGDLDAFIGQQNGITDYFQNTGSATNPTFAIAINPFGLSNAGPYSAPTFADIDGDGDLDAFIGDKYGDTTYFENTGSASSPRFANSVPNPFGLSNMGTYSTPTFADIDGDGDLDAFIGYKDGNGGDTTYFENTGSATNPTFANPVPNPFGLNNVGISSAPTLADIDGDGDLDVFIGNEYGGTDYFENTGSATSPRFANPVPNPSNLSNVGTYSAPTFADIDGDGDLDAFIGNRIKSEDLDIFFGDTNYFQNNSSAISPRFANPVPNPFGLSNVGTYSTPTFADIDGDGDLDAFIGDKDGDTTYFKNTGSATNPIFANPVPNPLGLSNVGTYSTPTFADIDGDGDLDAFIGDFDGDTNFFQNTGSASSPKFVTAQTNPFGLNNEGPVSAPTFADIDADGDLDAFIGDNDGNTFQFENTGSATRPQFTFYSLVPTNAVDGDSTPTFADIDADGDLDLFIGDHNGDTIHLQNTGSATNLNFGNLETNPFGLSNVGISSAPTFADIDGDGDLDAFIGDKDGNINFFRNNSSTNPPSLSGAGGQKQFAIAAGDGTTKISNFKGVGPGVNPAAAGIAEADTLQFTGADLTPEKLLLTQRGNDLELSFEGVAGTKVVLKNFALKNLDNLTQATGATVDLGNILFDGQSQIADSFDVFNANWQREQVFNRNSVTFLNDLDNTIQGFSRSDDVINAQGGNDWINGRSGDDLLRGGEGQDKLIGGKGNDTLVGGKGDDTLVGGQGNDLLWSGRGEDTFVLAANTGTDTVKNFQDGKDRLGLAGGLTFNQLTISQSSGNTLISITNGGEVLASLTGMNANLIGAADFAVV